MSGNFTQVASNDSSRSFFHLKVTIVQDQVIDLGQDRKERNCFADEPKDLLYKPTMTYISSDKQTSQAAGSNTRTISNVRSRLTGSNLESCYSRSELQIFSVQFTRHLGDKTTGSFSDTWSGSALATAVTTLPSHSIRRASFSLRNHHSVNQTHR